MFWKRREDMPPPSRLLSTAKPKRSWCASGTEGTPMQRCACSRSRLPSRRMGACVRGAPPSSAGPAGSREPYSRSTSFRTWSWVTLPAAVTTKWSGANQFWKRRSEEHTSELQSQSNLVCRLLLEKKKKKKKKQKKKEKKKTKNKKKNNTSQQ